MRQVVAGGSSAPKADGNAPASSKRTAAPTPKPADRPVSVEERKKQMAQLVEMGVAIPQEYRAEMALAGEWQTLSETRLETPDAEGAAKSIGVRKRKLEGDEDEEGGQIPEQYVNKSWGSRMRIYPGAQDDEEEDLDALLASTKELKKPKTAIPASETEEQKQESTVKEDESTALHATEEDKQIPVKTEETVDTAAPPADEKPTSEVASGPVFKKRKPKAMRK